MDWQTLTAAGIVIVTLTIFQNPAAATAAGAKSDTGIPACS